MSAQSENWEARGSIAGDLAAVKALKTAVACSGVFYRFGALWLVPTASFRLSHGTDADTNTEPTAAAPQQNWATTTPCLRSVTGALQGHRNNSASPVSVRV